MEVAVSGAGRKRLLLFLAAVWREDGGRPRCNSSNPVKEVERAWDGNKDVVLVLLEGSASRVG